MKKLISVTVLLFVMLGIVTAQNDLQSVAVVRLTKSEPITVKQFRTTVEQLEKSSGRALTLDERKQVLNSMIDQQLILQAADRDKITMSEGELNQQVQELRNQLAQSIGRAPTDAEFASAIRSQYELELPAFREQVRKQLLLQKYLMAKKGTELQSSIRPPTDTEITQFFGLHKSEFVRPDTVRVSMIQVPYGENVASKSRAKVLADRILAEIGSSPAKFDEAVQKSKAPNSGYQGGDAGYLPRNEQGRQVVGNNFLNIAFALRQGEVSTMIEGLRGFQIIKVTETYEMKVLQLDDVMDFASSTTVRAYIGEGLYQQRQQDVLSKVSTDLVTELRRGNPFTINENYLTW
ncbi:MAG: peptidylprolyl isomerase [Treponema sp.]|jgi:parvulin-like peptidyl-prolyl isomerase|nr:peptidylprolyl isomerase [Treponema sp.]